MTIPAADRAELKMAKELLENPGLAARISDVVGSPIEKGFDMLPAKWAAVVNDATRKSIETALDVALSTVRHDEYRAPSNWWHKLAIGTTGAAGGAFGLAALSIELPVSTTIMLRSIADIARSQGEDVRTADAKVQCVQVLALGGQSGGDDAAETGYFAARAAMARAVSDAARYIAGHGVAHKGAPALVRLIAQVAARFSVTVSEKAAAQAIPIVGAAGGALINTLFIDHFQRVATGHFTIRRLERSHDAGDIRRIYGEL